MIAALAGIFGAATGGGIYAATPPNAPVVPSAPALPSFQEMVSPFYWTGSATNHDWSVADNITQVQAQFAAGGYVPLRSRAVIFTAADAASSSDLGATVYALAPPDSSSTGYVVIGTNTETGSAIQYATNGIPFTSTVTYNAISEPNPLAGNVTVGALAQAVYDYPLDINSSITVATGSGNYASGSYGYDFNKGVSGSISASGGSYQGVMVVGQYGYSFLKISSGGTLNTLGKFSFSMTSGNYREIRAGTFVGGNGAYGFNVPAPIAYGDSISSAPFGDPPALETGTVSITAVTRASLNLGGPATGYGIVNVDGGIWNDSNGPIFLGYGSQGFVTIQQSGEVNLNNAPLIIGEDSTGLPSTAFNGQPLQTLPAGIGTMVVESEGSLVLTGSGGYVALGRSVGPSGATGKLYITGAGSTASVSQGLLVGDGGYGYLAVLSGGQVTSGSAYAAGGAKTLGVTSQPGSGNIIIDGVGSSWAVSGNADFGETGVAAVTVQNHGDLNILGTLTLGDQSTGSGTLTVQADGTVESGAATMGNQAGATGLANISDINTLWTVNGDLTVGNSGQGTLTLSNSAQIITTGDAILGSQSGSTGAATITDSGTQWQVNGELKIGDKGNGTMSVENGGLVSLAGNLAIADGGGTSTLTLDGNGSRLIASGTSVTVGGQGVGTLNVQNAADAIFSGASVSLGEQASGNGTLTVQGSNTVMSAGSLTIGGYGTGTLNVQDSAALSTGTSISLGEQASGRGTATIDNAAVNDAGTLTVGGYGTGTLTIQDGGSLTVQGNDITLGEQNTGTGTLNLVGSGSNLTFTGDMTIGKSGSGTLAVSGGAHFSGSAMTLASGSGFGGASTGGTGELDINGTSSVLLSQDLTIGKYGVGTLAMAGGAVLANKGDATLGSQPGTEGSATLSSSSNWTVGGSLSVGSQGTGSVTVQSASSLIANGDSFTIGKLGQGSLTVTGSKSSVQYAGDLIIGKQAAGTLSIANGATTAPTAGGAGDVYIAETSGISGALSIDGSGSNLAATNLVIGGTSSKAGGNGSVSLTNNGTLTIAKAVAMWQDGSLNASGGYATIGNNPPTAATDGNIYVTGGGQLSGIGKITGNVLVASGTVDVGGTKPGDINIAGNFIQSGGTLRFSIGGTGAGQASQLDATGSVNISGANVVFDFVDHYAPTKGQTFQVIDPPQSVVLNDVSYSFTGLESGFLFSTSRNANGLLFTALNNGIATSPTTPEPAALSLLLGSVGMLTLIRKRCHPLAQRWKRPI
jgi:T5SS/PEP-CTERM-associated repeat protein